MNITEIQNKLQTNDWESIPANALSVDEWIQLAANQTGDRAAQRIARIQLILTKPNPPLIDDQTFVDRVQASRPPR